MWSNTFSLIGAVVSHTLGAVARLSFGALENLSQWQCGQQIEETRNKHPHRQQQQQPEEGGGSTTRGNVPLPSSPADGTEMCHRQAVAGLTLLSQRVPSLRSGYHRPTLQSIYGQPFTSPEALGLCREVIVGNVCLYRVMSRCSTTTMTNVAAREKAAAESRQSTAYVRHGNSASDDIPLLVWIVMPCETGSQVVLRFVLRLAQSLCCDALFVTVPMEDACSPQWTVAALLSMIETGRRKTQARRVLIGGNDLAAMFVLLLLEHRCPLLHVGAFAAADPELARRALCQGVILVDPFVGWDMSQALRVNPAGPSSNQDAQSASRGHGSVQQRQQQQSSASSLTAKERLMQVVMDSSSGHIQDWFPAPITYEAPPMVVLVDEDGFWLQEQCGFNARVDRFGIGENVERVFFLPYVVETAAAGRLVSRSTQIELDRLWRMVEKFLADQLLQGEAHATSASTGATAAASSRVRRRLREGEATFMAAFAH